MQHTKQQNKREAMRRVQVGIGGLAAVILLVSLTRIVIDNVRQESLPPGEAGASASVAPPPAANALEAPQPSEPLADLGVTPAAEAGAAGASAPAVVPDLDPDPALQKPMDRDPGPTRNPNQN